MAAPPSLTLFFPMWNEEAMIGRTVDAALQIGVELVAAEEIADFDVLLVDDASTDATGALADALAETDPRVRVIHHETNRGLGGAIQTGLAGATGDFVLYTDADMPFDLAELHKALRLAAMYDADIIAAYRHDRTGEGLKRALYSYAYNTLARLALRLRIRDVNFAFKLIRRRVLEHLELRSEGSFIDAELLAKSQRLGFHIIQFGVDYFPRARGTSTLSSPKVILGIGREFASLYRDVHATRPVADHPIRVAEPPAGGRLLIVNADDFGLTTGVSRAILEAAESGIVTSTSVLAVAPAFAAMAPALASSGLGAGAHLAAVGEDPPLLTALEVPTLVDRDGSFSRSWRQLLPRVAAGRVDRDDLRREFAAQFEAITGAGITVTHVDTHQHVHLWPAIGQVVLEVAAAAGVSAVRIIRSGGRSPLGLAVNRLGRRFERRAGASGFRWPATATGLDEAGHLEGDELVAAIDRLGASGAASAELATHPGEGGDADLDRYDWGYEWADELDALRSRAAREAVVRHGFRLGTYADLEPA